MAYIVWDKAADDSKRISATRRRIRFAVFRTFALQEFLDGNEARYFFLTTGPMGGKDG